MMGCDNSSKFSKPLPWIGLYIAAASLLCSLLMGLDTFSGFRPQKLWFPCRSFSLNATSLTLLSVATELPVDLNTSIPRPQDQLAKLSGTVLICTVMGNFITSLGTMDESELISNVLALGILVLTVIVNIGIQMGTGVIYAFLPEHAVIMSLMLVLLVLLCSTAITAPTAKKLLEKQYDEIQMSSDEGCSGDIERQRKDVKKYWLMAHRGSPQYVVGRSATCTASGAFYLLSALILLQAAVRSLIIGSLDFCPGPCDYKWSVTVVLISQATAIVVGTIAPAIRWFNATSFRSPKSWKQSCKDEFKVEKYRVQRLVGWKESPLPFHVSSRRFRKTLHVSKNQIISVLIGIQCAVAQKASKPFSASHSGLSSYVLRLDGEEDLVQLIMTNGRADTLHWIHRGKSNPPKYLMQLSRRRFAISQGFQGVVEFDSNQVPSLGTETPPPNCWALPTVTLTSIAIAIAIPYIDKHVVKSLQRGVHESLMYVRLIEKNLDTKRLINMRKAADIVWLSIDICDHWLDKDLKKLALSETSADMILTKLAQIGEKYVLDYTARTEKENDPRDWPAKVLAANSMYRLCRTVLLTRLGTADNMFEWLQKTIVEILLVACLSNLPRVISMDCVCCPIELREESVREAAYLLGEAEEILIKQEIDLSPASTADIDDWILSKQKNRIRSPDFDNERLENICANHNIPCNIGSYSGQNIWWYIVFLRRELISVTLARLPLPVQQRPRHQRRRLLQFL
ncbi:hypothetical protein CKAN_01888700 [Cinnamomum micranthum f. kanehirae]|uniref:Uncharacterized protein n=1 Tax=Cinnamomum micranthum f. kanehirae TaxID=337451 RepID=A0A3S3QUH5_9MAGN|nr:hypothetical protein CKAN_01888700 [Cinnamomum micranthum f. kanehirae]